MGVASVESRLSSSLGLGLYLRSHLGVVRDAGTQLNAGIMMGIRGVW